MPEKIQKVLAQIGLGSRRQIERWIEEGRIQVNKKVAEIGQRLSGTETINFDGRIIALQRQNKTKPKLLLYHKPEGEICTRADEKDRPTVYDHLPRLTHSRWISIGRLDLNTSGLLLFTNDGELANKLMHPSTGIEREYAVRILGEVDKATLTRLRTGVELEDGMAHFDQIIDAGGQGANHWYHVILHEGRNREVRRLWESQGVMVSRLTRVRFGNITLPRFLRKGKWKYADESQLTSLYQLVASDDK